MQSKIYNRTTFSIAFGGMTVSICVMMINTYLMYYLTEIAGFSAMFAGMAFMAGRIWDIVNDPLVGVLIDRRNFAGKLLLYTALPLAASLALLFTVDAGSTWGYVSLCLYLFIFFLAYTAADIPLATLNMRYSTDKAQFEKLNALKMTISIVGVVLSTSLVLPLVGLLGQGNERSGYLYTMIFIAIIVFISLIIAYANTKAINVRNYEQTMIKLKDYIRAMKGNRNWIIIFAAMLISWVGSIVRQQIFMYFMKYYINDVNFSSILLFTGYAVNGALMFLGPWFCRRFGVVRSIITGISLTMLGQLIIFFGGTNLTTLLIGNILLCAFMALPSSLIFILVPDVVGYGLKKTGKDITGMVNSTLSFASKLGMTLGGMLCSVYLAWSGYDQMLEVQSEQFITSLRYNFHIAQFVCSAICIVLYLLYRKTNEDCFSIQSRNDKELQLSGFNSGPE